MLRTPVREARFGNMSITFDIPLSLIGVDETQVYFIDTGRHMQGLPYIHSFTKEWQFKEAGTEHWFAFEFEAL
nr:MAG TPA: hypothetical protein [Caudoviricetes sp.]